MSTRKIVRVKIQNFLRRIRLSALAEKVRYYSKVCPLKKKNDSFIRQNLDFALPPEYVAFDAYSAQDWNFYKTSGEGTARFLAETVKKYLPAGQALTSIYEWGCGPGRVVRHLPAQVGNSVEVHWSDRNLRYYHMCLLASPS